MDNPDTAAYHWLNDDGELQESLRLGLEFGVFKFDGVSFTLDKNWRQGIAEARKACSETD